MCKKLPVDDFKWLDDLSIFTEDFIKNHRDIKLVTTDKRRSIPASEPN